jgi:hypothetical protein
MKKNICLEVFFLFVFVVQSFSQNNCIIKVHFLYGSKPKKEYKEVETKWFGGILGGHVGIEVDSNKVINFVPDGRFHWLAHSNNCHCKFAVHTADNFFEIFGGASRSVKKSTVIIPISKQQKQKLDSIFYAYTSEAPYDYAFIGMRCSSAAYDILGQIGIFKQYSYRRTIRKIFYPRRLRKKLYEKAKENNWKVIRQNGTERRKWEED